MALTEEQSLRQAIAREEANLTTLELKQQKRRERLAISWKIQCQMRNIEPNQN